MSKGKRKVSNDKRINPFAYMQSISNPSGVNKEDTAELSERLEELYNPFLTTRFFSFHADTVLIANELNHTQHAGMSKRDHFLVLQQSIPKTRNPRRWIKGEPKDEIVEMIMEAYDLSYKKAREARRIMSEADINILRESLAKGGRSNSNAKKSRK